MTTPAVMISLLPPAPQAPGPNDLLTADISISGTLNTYKTTLTQLAAGLQPLLPAPYLGVQTYFGTGAPSGSIGNNNDNFVDIATGNLYTKSSGTWSYDGVLSAGSSADATARAAAATAQSTANAALPLSGGTLSGALTLAAAPTASLQAATKSYVDSGVASALPLAGGTLSGALTLAAAPTASLQAATKAYVDSGVASALPLAGGTVASLSVSGAFTGNASSLTALPANQAGASARSLAAFFGEQVSVASFSPYADGATSDLTAFTAANTASLAAAGLIYFPSASYAGDGSAAAGLNDSIALGLGNIVQSTVLQKQIADPRLLTAPMFPVNVGPQHLVNFHAACATGSAKVAVWGDSNLGMGSNTNVHSEYVFNNKIASEIRKANPGVALTFFNAAVGGTTLATLASLSTGVPAWFPPALQSAGSWQQAVQAFGPNVVLLYTGGNDGYAFAPLTLKTLLTTMAGWASPPSVILCSPMQGGGAGGFSASTYAANEFVGQWQRTYSEKYGTVGFLDFRRQQARIVGGFDPTQSALTIVTPAGGTNLTAFGVPQATDSNGNWVFPAVANPEGVLANNCTDFSINFTLNTPPNAVLTFTLFPNGINAGQPYLNAFYANLLTGGGGYIATSWSDSAAQNLDQQTSTVALPTAAAQYQFTLKNGNVYLAVNNNNVTDTSPPTGLGYTTIWEGKIVRFGGAFNPSIQGIGVGNTITINNLAIGSSSQITNNSARFRPGSDDNSIYNATAAAGGGSYVHQNAYGRLRIFFPVIEGANWAPPNSPALTASSLLAPTTGNLTLGAVGLGAVLFSFNAVPVVSLTQHGFVFSPQPSTSGTPLNFLYNSSADTGITAGAESPNFVIANATRTWLGGTTVALQRDFRIDSPILAATSATTFSAASSLSVSGAPALGANASGGTTSAVEIRGNAVGAWATANGLFVTAPSGATVNYAINAVGNAILSGTLTCGSMLVAGSGNQTLGAAGAGGILLSFNGTARASFTQNTSTFAPLALATGSGPHFIYTGPADTGITAGTESSSAVFTNATRTWAGGTTVALQREFRFDPPNLAASSATTFSDASTVSISGAPVASTNASLTTSSAFEIRGNAVGSGVTNAYGLFVTAPSGATGSNLAINAVGAVVVGSAAAAAFVVGPNGTTNPALKINASATSSVTGINLVTAATGGGVSLTATDSGAATAFSVYALGTGNMIIGTTGAGGILYNFSGTARFSATQNYFNFVPAAWAGSNSNAHVQMTMPSDTALIAATEYPSVLIDDSSTKQFATGAMTLQRGVLIKAPTYSAVAASTFTQVATLGITGAPIQGANATLLTSIGLLISGGATGQGGAGTAIAAQFVAPSGSANNFAAAFNGDVLFNGSLPTVSAGTIVTGSTDHKGQVTGLSGATALTIMFTGKLGAAPTATLIGSAALSNLVITSISQTGVTFGFSAYTGSLYYHCF